MTSFGGSCSFVHHKLGVVVPAAETVSAVIIFRSLPLSADFNKARFRSQVAGGAGIEFD